MCPVRSVTYVSGRSCNQQLIQRETAWHKITLCGLGAAVGIWARAAWGTCGFFQHLFQ
jgi:hypothetical protein